MHTRLHQLASALLWSLVVNASASVLYVDLNSTNPTPPYTSWQTAAASIQDAMDTSAAGDQILVTNGVYATGGRVVYGSLTKRVAVTKPVTVQSANGPTVTVIEGYRPGYLTNAVRCAYLTHGATLAGFTLTNGTAGYYGDPILEKTGGGVWCESTSAVVSNCLITENKSLVSTGGGAFGGTLNNCILTRNSAYEGAGACSNTLNNCLLAQNAASLAGGRSLRQPA